MKKIITIKYFEVGLHLLFWLIYFTYPIIKFGDHQEFTFKFNESIRDMFFIGASVYTTYFFLSKKFQGFYNAFVLLIILLFLLYINCHLYVQNCQCYLKSCLINKAVEYLMVNAFFVAIFTIKKNIISQSKLEKIEKESIKAELKGLRAQINPHFFFNTLNMLYSNAIIKDAVLADKILKLSDSLHYLMHEGNKKHVTLSQEIEFINGYIDLNKARMNEKIAVQFINKVDNEKQLIPPLLLIPFIENAFKYSSMMEGKQIPLIIDLKLKDTVFCLSVENTFDKDYSIKQSKSWKESGIGLSNVKRRLDLLFPSKHELTIDSTSETNNFKVVLTIDLK